MPALLLPLLLVTVLKGDSNCDGAVDFNDINPFVTALTSGAVSWAEETGCAVENYLCLNDVNGDGAVDFADINPFVALLTHGSFFVNCEPAVQRPGPPAPPPLNVRPAARAVEPRAP